LVYRLTLNYLSEHLCTRLRMVIQSGNKCVLVG
jgi:hypothetical protein